MNGQITVKLIEETSVVVNWTTTTTINKLEYSTDNGKTWKQQSVVAGTGDICRISGLTPNTEYKIVLRFTYTGGSLTSTSSSNTLTVKTYNYPYIIDIEKLFLPIGDSQSIEVYNPLNREVTIQLVASDGYTVIDSIISTENNVTFTPNKNTLYASIPNDATAECMYFLWAYDYEDKKTYKFSDIRGYYYGIESDEALPTFTDFTYKDTNVIVSSVLETNQELVKGLSNLQVTISSANKMIANYHSTPSHYNIICTACDFYEQIPYSDNEIFSYVGIPKTPMEGTLLVSAYDSRGLFTNVGKRIIVYDYQKPTVEVTGSRLNNFEEETTIKINGTYSPIIRDGANKNIVTLQYRYDEVGGDFMSEWIEVTPILNGNNVTCNDIVLSLDRNKIYNIEVMIADSFRDLGSYAFTNCTIDKGEAIFFISNNKRACYINGQKISMPFILPVATVEDVPTYYLLAKLPPKSGSNGTLRINGFLGDRASSFKAVIDCLIANRGGITVTGTWYGKSSAFNYLNDIEIYEQANGEHWIYLKVKSKINGGVLLDIEGTDILSDEYTYDYVTTPSGTLVYTINDSTLTEIGEKVHDTGWINVSKSTDIADGTIGGVPQYRKIGNEVFLRGSYKGNKSTGNLLLGTLSSQYRPKVQEYRLVPLSGSYIARIFITTTGNIYLEWIISLTTPSVYTGNFNWLQINTSFFADN